MIRRPHRFAFAVFGGVLALWLVVMLFVMRDAALPASAEGTMLVVFEPGTSEETAFAAITQAGAKPIRKTDFGFIWVVNGNAGALQQAGALGTYKELPISPVIAGCLAVVDAKAADAFGL
jgi:uncharacterized membrane protein YdfJ with MMPL/SSD domain